MNNWTIVVFGISGDLCRRKLIPAIYNLCFIDRKEFSCDPENSKLKEKDSVISFDKNLNFSIVGIGRHDTDISAILDAASKFIKNYNPDFGEKLKKRFTYIKADFNDFNNFALIKKTIEEREKKFNLPGNRLVYLATGADFFCPITEKIAESGIIGPGKLSHRIIYEKPFGWDEESSKKINSCARSKFEEAQIYRADHYLAKNFINNFFILRYTNTIFKSIWNKDYVAACKILLHEKLGLEGRGLYYDKFGAVRDVLQNHMLQMLALTAMDLPNSFNSEDIRDKKVEILKNIQVYDGIFGQYEGYQNEPNVSPDSKTETYAAVNLFLDHANWKGVPFYLETGKKMARKLTEIQLIFKPIFFENFKIKSENFCRQNVLRIQIGPKEKVSLKLNMKKNGTFSEVCCSDLDLVSGLDRYQELSEDYKIINYETILREVFIGEQAVSVRFDEVEAQWKITDEIYRRNFPAYTYKAETLGPKERPW